MHLTVNVALAEPRHPTPTQPKPCPPDSILESARAKSPPRAPSLGLHARGARSPEHSPPSPGPVLLAVDLPKPSLAWAAHSLLWRLLPPPGLLFGSSAQSDSAKACVCILSLPGLRSPGPPCRGQSPLTPPPLLSPWLSPGGLASPSRSSPAPA